jgi:hypothetical protein
LLVDVTSQNSRAVVVFGCNPDTTILDIANKTHGTTQKSGMLLKSF